MFDCPSLFVTNKTKYIVYKDTKTWHVYLIFFIIAFVSIGLCRVYNFVRKYVYRDKENLDIEFNAGGQVSIGLVATTLVSQWTWASTFLVSTDQCIELGISGTFWYATGATVQMLLFSIISVQLRIRAPGAKTFLQVIRARFGKEAHITFCVFALITNLLVTVMLMIGGGAVLQQLVENQSLELSLILICGLVGGLTFSGGLGATFYVCYFASIVMFIIVIFFNVSVFHVQSPKSDIFGNISRIYDYLSCMRLPASNSTGFLSMVSESGLVFGVSSLVGNFATIILDQSFWQNSVAAKPKEGLWGFIIGGIVWFSIPFAFSTSMGFAYLILNSKSAQSLLNSKEIQSGLATPLVAHILTGFGGELLIIIVLILAVTTTATAEVMAVTSILIYDIYAIYLQPYRKTLDVNSCLLCGKMRGKLANPRDKCKCESMTFCESCLEDDTMRNFAKISMKPQYSCKSHGKYRIFLDHLKQMKNWCTVLVTIGIIPVTIVLNIGNINLSWLYGVVGIITGSAIVPVILTVLWSRLTGNAAIVGTISGSVCAIILWLAYASTFHGGLSYFYENTSKNEVLAVGNSVAILLGASVTIILSYAQTRNESKETIAGTWEKTRDIDNPLSPWPETYAK